MEVMGMDNGGLGYGWATSVWDNHDYFIGNNQHRLIFVN